MAEGHSTVVEAVLCDYGIVVNFWKVLYPAPTPILILDPSLRHENSDRFNLNCAVLKSLPRFTFIISLTGYVVNYQLHGYSRNAVNIAV